MNKIQLNFYLARDENGSLYLFSKIPEKGIGIWWCFENNYSISELDRHLYPEVKWEDEEPTKITLSEV